MKDRNVMKRVCALCAITLLLMAGCSGVQVQDYTQSKPQLDIRDYFKGDVEATGIFIDTSGKADPMFHVSLHGDFQTEGGTLQEHFVYNDGHMQDRTWIFAFSSPHHFTGTAIDVIGVAAGEQFGNAAHMDYVLTVATKDGSVYDMSMNDWLYLMDDKTLINRNEMRKLGFKVGELIITFHKLDLPLPVRKEKRR
jgi:hypothetical protein